MPLIPVGVTDFRKLRLGSYYFIDKSMFIADIMRTGAEVTLLPRPRRFGKTMNFSMLYRFLDMRQDNAELFEGLAVSNHQDVMDHLGSWPTVFMSFKDIKYSDFNSCLKGLAFLLGDLIEEHEELIENSNPSRGDRMVLDSVVNHDLEPVSMERTLKVLTKLIHRATGKKAIVLIDEYDMPIHSGYANGYYEEIISFMRNLLSGAFKDNDHLHKGVLTGILRIAKESIFSGFNNPDVLTLLDEPFSEHFGFTETEVTKILEDVGMTNREAEVRKWYNGYRFGSHTIYNPWSIMKMAAHPHVPLQPHWVNTSDNMLIRKLIKDENVMARRDLETLLSGEVLVKDISSSIVLGAINERALWSMLTFSGYLKVLNMNVIAQRIICELTIPNLEVSSFYDETVRDWIDEKVGNKGLAPLLNALLTENIDLFSAIFSEIVVQMLSFHDTAGSEPERVYHTFMLGMLAHLRGSYEVSSNRESGLGRYDVSLIPEDSTKPAFLFEFKAGGEVPKQSAKDALEQIILKDYAATARSRGVSRIHALGVAVSGKTSFMETRLL